MIDLLLLFTSIIYNLYFILTSMSSLPSILLYLLSHTPLYLLQLYVDAITGSQRDACEDRWFEAHIFAQVEL